MPLWLRGLGIQVSIPNLTAAGLLGHVVWGGRPSAGRSLPADSGSDAASGPETPVRRGKR